MEPQPTENPAAVSMVEPPKAEVVSVGPGRPLSVGTLEELELAVEDWKLERIGQGKPLTLGSLALALGVDRKTILNYEKRDEFFHTIRKARELCESYAEDCLFDREKPVAGVIFNLVNNYGWKNAQHTDITSGGKSLTVEVQQYSPANPVLQPPQEDAQG